MLDVKVHFPWMTEDLLSVVAYPVLSKMLVAGVHMVNNGHTVEVGLVFLGNGRLATSAFDSGSNHLLAKEWTSSKEQSMKVCSSAVTAR